MDICLNAFETIGNSSIIIIWIFLIVLNIICLLGIFLISYIIFTLKLFHLHLRILLFSLHISFLLRTIGTTYRALDFLIILIIKKSNCDLLNSSKKCKIISLINSGAISTILYTFILITIERTVASLFFRKYEMYKYFLLSMILASIIWIQPLYNLINYIFQNDFWSQNKLIPYCNSQTSKVANFEKFLFIELPISGVIFLFNVINFFYCKYKLKKIDNEKVLNNNISMKFQLKEICLTSKNIAILTILYLIDLVINTALVVKISVTKYKDDKSFAFDKELSAIIIPLYIIVYCIAFSIFCTNIRRKVISLLLFGKKIDFLTKKSIAPLGNTDDYFKIYKNNWS